MKILFIGNSFTYYNDMPSILSGMLGEEHEVRSVTKGGYYLSRHLDDDDALGGLAIKTLSEWDYDYVVLQEQSFCPIEDNERFMRGVIGLSKYIREGAKPVMYATWAYRDGSEKLSKTGLGYREMRDKLQEAYFTAGEAIGADTLPVGMLMHRMIALHPETDFLNEKDNYHPSRAGSIGIAELFSLYFGIEPDMDSLPEEDRALAAALLTDARESLIMPI